MVKQKTKKLKQTKAVLLEFLMEYAWRCSRCGWWSQHGYICHNCGYDKTGREQNNE